MKLFNILFSKNSLNLSSFQNYIFKVIQHTGPMSVHNFMKETLTHEDHGYYMHRTVFGEKGDFITSPEISQIFGELFGIWIVNEWMNQGKVKPFQLVEIGPGKGTLMSDALTAINKFPELFDELSIKLVEISPKMRQCQEIMLKKCFNKLGKEISVEWLNDLNELPKGIASCFLAHEFFDVLPIHKFRRNNNGKWREILIDVDKSDLKFILSNKETIATLAFKNILDKYPLLNDFELSPLSLTILDNICRRITDDKGFSLIADYGHLGDKGDTFRAFKSHQVTNPLINIGDSDLTADVNFNLFTDHLHDNWIEKLIIYGPICQNMFLNNMGIDIRLQILLDNCQSRSQVDYLIGGYRIMMDEEQMGNRVKFLSILPLDNHYLPNYLPAGFCKAE